MEQKQSEGTRSTLNFLSSYNRRGGAILATFLASLLALTCSTARAAATLPNNTSLVEYIESDGKAYINTKYVPNSSTEIEMEFAFTEERTDKLYVFGSYGANGAYSGGRFQFSYGPTSSGCFLGYGSAYSNSVMGIAYNTARHVMKYVPGGGFYFDGSPVDTGSVDLTKWAGTGANLFLGALNPNGGTVNTSLIAPLRIFSCKISENGVLKHDFLPASLTNGTTVCLFDAVDGSFATKSGTGDFRAGEAIPLEYKDALYIQSNRSAYINTQHTPTEETAIEMTFAFTQTLEKKTYVFGVYGADAKGRFQFSYGPSATGCFLGYGSNYKSDVRGLTYDTARHTVKYVPGEGFYFDGALVTTASVDLTTWQGPSTNLYLGWLNSNNRSDPENLSPIRIYGCKIWEGGTLVRDLKPKQRKFDGKNGLYDDANGVFYAYYGIRADFTAAFPTGLCIFLR